MAGLEKVLAAFTACIILLGVPAVNTAGFKLTNMRCTALDQSVGEFKVCSMKAVKRDVVEINVHLALATKPINNATLTLRLKKRGNNDKKAIYQYQVDMCAFLSSERRNPLANLFYNIFEFKKYSNINHSCPYDHDLIVNRCRINTKLFNMLAIATGEYTIDTMWSLYGKPAANIEVFFRIE